FRSLGMALPDKMVNARDHIYRKFTKLLAQFMPFDLVIDEQTADGTEARVSKTSVCGSWGPIAGDLRYFADRSGIPRAAIEGTQIPPELIRANATRGKAEIVYDPRRKHGPLALRRKVEYFGFELEREVDSLDEFPPELATEARHVLADSLARGEARHFAVRKNQSAIDEIRESYKRSGGQTGKLGLAELTALYEEQLAQVGTMEEFKAARLTVDRQRFVPGDIARELAELPSVVTLRDRDVELDYDVEDAHGTPRGVVRLRLPEKIARTLTEDEIPKLDRPVKFVVLRGQRGAVRADTLEDLQEKLRQPWSPDEVDDAADDAALLSKSEREVREIASEFRRHRAGGQRHDRGGRAGRQSGRGGSGGGGQGGAGRKRGPGSGGKPGGRSRRRGR
ncbi:MAG TPA: DEAD/DEAH box helicase, partial [Gemmatimonadaceae bacterium]|nr:DEAD/DEAH box helicase [Gemmatimonadaceae bacterium]